jgi:hypothetical protein
MMQQQQLQDVIMAATKMGAEASPAAHLAHIHICILLALASASDIKDT